MTKGFYGSKDDEEERYGLIGIVIATQPRGEVASILYSPGDPLWVVGRELYEAVPQEEESREGRSKYRYKDQLSIGDQVEFGVDEETRRVKWMRKSPQWLKIDCSGGVPTMTVIGVVTDSSGKELRLWSDKTGYIGANKSDLESAPKDCPMWCKIRIMLDYGDYEGEEFIQISEFRPVYWFELVSFKKKSVSPEAGVAMLRKAPWIKATEGKTIESKAIEGMTIESKAIEGMTIESKATESKATESKAIESKATESKAIESKVIKRKAVESSSDFLETVFDQATKAEEEMSYDGRLDETLTSQLKLLLGL